MAAVAPLASRSGILSGAEAAVAWTGAPLTLAINEGAAMAQTPNGSAIFAYQNVSAQNNQGKLVLTSGGGAPEFYVAPALVTQPNILVRNWKGSNLNVTNISVNTDTPIWIEAFGPGLGPAPKALPIGQPVAVNQNDALQGTANANWMQLTFRLNASQLAVFGIIGGPPDASGNNAYVIALNSASGDTGPGTGKTPPAGYYATAGGNTYSYEFNWGASTVFVAYFGSAQVVTTIDIAMQPPTVTMLSL